MRGILACLARLETLITKPRMESECRSPLFFWTLCADWRCGDETEERSGSAVRIGRSCAPHGLRDRSGPQESAGWNRRSMGVKKKKSLAVDAPREKKAKYAKGYGIDVLRKAVDKEIRKEVKELAEALIQNFKEGHVASGKLACALAEEQKLLRGETVRKAHPSLASQWANEPEWKDTPDEGSAETGCGGVEPE